ncbi:HprK-related kinase A [Sedimenticola selenatireducens]|nr:HprK-related kinase A [Sedimenticola selenatireducens]
MKITDLSHREMSRRLRGNGLPIKIGPFWISLRSVIPDLLRHIAFFYAQYETAESERFFDFHITLKNSGGLRRWVKPQANFLLDEYAPFKPLPYVHAFAMFEWGLNWCIATTAHHYLIVHAAVLDKDGQGIIMPGVPGSGKSTLCAAMSLRGWRLLSDEMALLDPVSRAITPVPRPVSLKNDSIGVIRRFSAGAELGPAAKDTAKGTVAHLRPSLLSIQNASITCLPHAIIFPKYEAGSDTNLVKKAKNRALMEIQENAFNSHILGKEGFDAAKSLVNSCPNYSLQYSSLEEALVTIERILEDAEVTT